VEPRKLIQLSSLAIARDEGFFVVQKVMSFLRGIVVFAQKRGEGALINMKSAHQGCNPLQPDKNLLNQSMHSLKVGLQLLYHKQSI